MSTFSDLVEAQQALTDSRVQVSLVGRPERRYEVRIPSLLEQLYAAAVDASMHAEEGGTRMKPKSKPPVALEAMSRFQDIDKASRRWVRSVRATERLEIDRNVRELVSAAAGHRGYLAWDEETVEALLTEMQSWQRWAAVLTGWQSVPKRPYIKCPVCDGVATIWVNMAVGAAYCSACKFEWADCWDLADEVAA